MEELRKIGIRVATNRIPSSDRWIAFENLGTQPYAFLPRLLLLWIIGVPLLCIRALVSGMLIFTTLGFPAAVATLTVTVIPVGFQASYRHVTAFMMENEVFQFMWDAVATMLAVFLNILVYAIRLLVEIWDGFCPILVLFADLIYELLLQLVAIFFATPLLQYFLFWLIRLVVNLTEPALDLLMTVFETLMFLVVDIVSLVGPGTRRDSSSDILETIQIQRERATSMGMSLDEFIVYCDQHPENEMCYFSSSTDSGDHTSRRLLGVEEEVKRVGDLLLEVVTVVFSVILRLAQACIMAFLPLMYSFLRLVLPKAVQYIVVAVELVAVVCSIFVSEPVQRIMEFVIQLLPMLFEFIGGILCSLVIYLGAAGCYVLYVLVVTLSFILKYMIKPIACGVLTAFAGCLESMVMAAIDGESCYTCGNYNTACGCRKHTMPKAGCGGMCIDTSDKSNPIDVAPPEPTNEPKITERSKHYGSTMNFMDSVISNPDTHIDEGITDSANVQTPGRDVSSDLLPTKKYGNVTDSKRIVVISDTAYVIVSASPGQYAEMALIQHTTATSETMVLVLGSLPRYSEQPLAPYGTIVCMQGISTDCTVPDVWSALSRTVETEGPVGVLDPNQRRSWMPVDWFLRANPNGEERANPWIRFDLKTLMVVLRLRMFWGGNDVALLAPTHTKMEFFTHKLQEPDRVIENTYTCGIRQHSRHDFVELGKEGLITNSVKLTLLSSCDDARKIENFGSLYELMNVYISAVPAGEELTSTFLQSIPLSVRILSAENVEMWDACEQKNLDTLVDGKHGFKNGPVVFSRVNNTKHTEIALSFRMQEAVTIKKIVLHLKGPVTLPHTLLTICPKSRLENDSSFGSYSYKSIYATSPECATADALTDFGSSTSKDFVNARAKQFSEYVSEKTNSSSIGFYTEDYYDMTYGELGRDASYTFEFNEATYTVDDDSKNDNEFVMWISTDRVDAFDFARPTTWATVLLELGLDPAQTQSAQWRLDPSTSSNCPRDASNSIDSKYFSSESNAFGASSNARSWFAIEEVSLFGYVAKPTGANRRLLSEDDDPFVVAQRALKDRVLSTDRNSARVSVADVMHPLSNSHGKFSRSSAPENGNNQPFFDDLSLMPDPSIEPNFNCRRNDTKMRCFAASIYNLPGPSSDQADTQKTDTHPNETWSAKDRPESTRLARRKTGMMDAYKKSDITLQQRLASLDELRTQREILQDTSAKRRVLGETMHQTERTWTNQFPHLQETRAGGNHASSRRILGSGPFDGIKDWVTDFVDDFVDGALDAFENVIKMAMGCDSYSTKEDPSIGECFEELGQYLLEGIFQCNRGENILDCISRPFENLFMDALKSLLRRLLWLADQVGGFLGSVTGIGDMLKNIACIGCSLTGLVIGVLADFVDDFSISSCSSIVDKGTSQCNAWDLGAEDFGANTFGNVFKFLKITFGLVQILPAFGEVVVELAIVLATDMVGIFPELIGDAYDILLFLFASSETIATVELLFEAFDPLITGDDDSLQSKLSRTTSQKKESTPDMEEIHTISSTNVVCHRDGETTESTSCGEAYRSLLNTTNQNVAELTTSDSALSFPLDASCSCHVAYPACKRDGPSTANCKFQEGTFVTRLREKQALMDIMKNQTTNIELNSTNNASDCSHWPNCATVQARTIGANFQASGEFQNLCVHSKKCKIQTVAPMESTKASDFPFACFSRNMDQKDNAVFWHKGDQCPSKLRVNDILQEESVHRRRSISTNRRMARRLMGIDDLFDSTEEDNIDTSQANDRNFDEAIRGFNHMLRTGNKSYAYYQVNAIREEMLQFKQYYYSSYHNITQVFDALTGTTRFKQTIDYTRRVIGNGRKLLFGFSGEDIGQSIGCGWLDSIDYTPNTYPCCRGMYCCVPPPFPDDFRPEKKWFEWQDKWHHDNECPYIKTYFQGWLFLLRAISKGIREISNEQIGVWPYVALVDTFWSVFLFPEDKWPDSGYMMLRCVTLNIGVYIVLLLLLVLIASIRNPLLSVYYANIAIAESRPRKKQVIPLNEAATQGELSDRQGNNDTFTFL